MYICRYFHAYNISMSLAFHLKPHNLTQLLILHCFCILCREWGPINAGGITGNRAPKTTDGVYSINLSTVFLHVNPSGLWYCGAPSTTNYHRHHDVHYYHHHPPHMRPLCLLSVYHFTVWLRSSAIIQLCPGLNSIFSDAAMRPCYGLNPLLGDMLVFSEAFPL